MTRCADFTEAELKQLEDPKRTPAFGWFVSDAYLAGYKT